MALTSCPQDVQLSIIEMKKLIGKICYHPANTFIIF